MSGCCDGSGGTMLTERDPVCGKAVNRVTALRHEHEDKDYFFCSEHCCKKFIANPSETLASSPQPVVASWSARAWAWVSGVIRMEK